MRRSFRPRRRRDRNDAVLRAESIAEKDSDKHYQQAYPGTFEWIDHWLNTYDQCILEFGANP